nr:hypothetical protein [Tanacetum cinerariifolium]
MKQQKYELDCKVKMEVIEREANARVNFYNSQKISADLVFIDEPIPVDQEPIDDPDDASIDPHFKVKKGVSYPKHDPTIPWNEMQHVLGMRNVNAGRCAGMYINKSMKSKRNCLMMIHWQALLESNPGSTCRLDVEDTSAGKSYFKILCLLQGNERWAFFNLSVKCPDFENEICESYHRVILMQRHKPIITMLEDIRVYLMQRVVPMHNIAINLEDHITPTIRKKLEYWTVFPSAYQELEVSCGDSAFGLNLAEKRCACRFCFQNSSGDFGPELSFDKSAPLEHLFSLARVSLAEASKPVLSFGCSGEDYTSSCPPGLVRMPFRLLTRRWSSWLSPSAVAFISLPDLSSDLNFV